LARPLRGYAVKASRFLFAIAVGVVILVAALLISVLLRFNMSPYQAEDTPEGVARNYLLALQRKDYERAYHYLSTTLSGYPANVEQFASDIEQLASDVNRPPYDVNWYREDVALTVGPTWLSGDEAGVTVVRTRIGSGNLVGGEPDTFTFYMGLRRENGVWKIQYAEGYWSGCWYYRSNPGCR
jgi:hypothetical protein